MRRFATAVLAAAVVLALAGCATPTDTPPPEPAPTPTPTASATPAAQVRTVGPTEMPPTVFDGDCALALTAEEAVQITGLPFALESSESSGSMANVGGVNCTWHAEPVALRVQIIPQAGLDDAEFPEDSVDYYFEDCDPNWVCGWRWESEDLWIAGSFQFAADMTRESIDAWGSALGAAMGAHFEANPGEPWERDRTGWWDTLDCQAAATAIGDGLGMALAGEQAGYIDPPAAGWVMADIAAHMSDCAISVPDGGDQVVLLHTTAGTGSAPPEWVLSYTPVDLGVDGITASTGGRGPYGGEQYYLTDGVNTASIEARSTATHSPEQIAAAVARAAASGFE